MSAITTTAPRDAPSSAPDNVRPLRPPVARPPAPAPTSRRRRRRNRVDARAIEHARTAAPWSAGDPLVQLARFR